MCCTPRSILLVVAMFAAGCGTRAPTTDDGTDDVTADSEDDVSVDADGDAEPDSDEPDVEADIPNDSEDDPAPDDVVEDPVEPDVIEDPVELDVLDEPDVLDDPEPDSDVLLDEDCTNGIDDDGDGLIDAADGDCEDVRACAIASTLCEGGGFGCLSGEGPDCSNGDDDDGDGMVDCDDPDCAADPVCVPAPCIEGECGDDERCDVWTGRCVAADAPDPVGADIGEPCTSDGECRTAGHLGGDFSPTCSTAWEEGSCMGFCTVCEEHWSGETLPRRECPSGSVCLPGDQHAQTDGGCVRECHTDDDCRSDGEWPGEYCRQDFWVEGETLTFSNGYCAPLHCETRGCSGWVCGC